MRGVSEEVGTQNLQLEECKEKSEIALIDVTKARLAGALPIPFHYHGDFLAYQYDYDEVALSEEEMAEEEFTEEKPAAAAVEKIEEDEATEEGEVIAAGDEDTDFAEFESKQQAAQNVMDNLLK